MNMRYLQERRGISLIALAVASVVAMAPAATAQEQADPAPAQPASEVEGEIVVTARLRSERLQDVPVAITAVTGDKMDSLQVTSVTDLAKFVPSMVVGRQTTGSSASIFLRGVGSSSLSAGFDQSVSFNLDGLAMTRGREIAFAQYDIDRVEVLKGPQALFFGKNTTAGLVSIITRGPTDKFEVSGKVGYGFVGDEVYAEAAISGPITDTLKARLAVRASDVQGYFTNTAGPANDPAQNNFARAPVDERRGVSSSVSGRLTVVYDPTPELSIVAKAGLTKFNDNGASELNERFCGSGRTTPRPSNGIVDPFADCKIDGRNDYSTLPIEVARGMLFARDGRPYTNFDSEYGVLNASYDLGQVSLTSITGFYHFTQQALNTVSGAVRAIGVTESTDFRQFSQELRLQSDLDGAFNFMIGGYYSNSDLRLDTDTYAQTPAFDPVNQTYSTYRRVSGFDASSTSVFGELTWAIVPTLELSGGARASWEKRDSFLGSRQANSAYNASFPPNLLISDNYEEDNVSPQATLRWKPNPDVTIYGAYKTGFKGGGFNISTSLNAATTVAANRFKSESAEGGEIGAHLALFDRRLRFNLTAYRYVYSDLQVQFFDSSTLSQRSANAGKLITQGIEADFNWSVAGVDGLSFRGASAYLDAEYRNFIGQCYTGQSVSQGCNQVFALGVYQSQDFGGRRPQKAPEFSAQLGTTYSTPLSGSIRATTSADMTYSSSYNFSDALRPDAVQKAFARIDATLRIEDEDRGWSLGLIGRNLTNKLVITSQTDVIGTASSPAGTGTTAGGIWGDYNVQVERGREIYLEVGFRF